jgi:hypothetical protein
VSWRSTLNSVLVTTTGYQVAKRRPPKSAKPLPRHYDAAARAVIADVRPWTMTSPEKLFALMTGVRYVVRHDVPGAIVECGVWRGGSMQAIARTLLAHDAADRPLHLYDTFEGMPPPGDEDRRRDGLTARELLELRPQTSHIWAVAGLDDVREGMAATGYPPELVNYHPGLVEETIPAGAPEEIALLRLDTDWYASTRHELEHLYQRLVTGGIVIFDDYDYWDGAKLAVEEFIEETGIRLFLAPMASGRIAVKPA